MTAARRTRTLEVLPTLVVRQLRLRTKRSWLGNIWPSVAPLVLLFLYLFVFGRVFDVPVEHYGDYLFAGLLPWTFLAQTLGLAVIALWQEPELVRRGRFPLELVPISTVCVMGLYFLLTLAGFVVYLAFVGRLHVGVLPALAAPVVAVWLLVASISMLLSLIDVYNHDLRQVLGNLLTVWFFVVPIAYRPSMAPRSMQFLRSVDPVNMIVGQFRDVLYYGHLSRPAHMVVMLLVCSAALVLSRRAFAYLGRDIAKDL